MGRETRDRGHAHANVRAYLSLGSNLGDRLANLAGAISALANEPALSVVALSPVYETAPLGADGRVAHDQPAFLNCALAVDTQLDAQALRAVGSHTERAFGRRDGERWQPRPIDIDLVLYGDQRITTPELTVPHPRMLERAFVLRPLVDINPDIGVPGVGTLAPLLQDLAWQGIALHTTASELRALIDAGR